jgi:hypothetical protein
MKGPYFIIVKLDYLIHKDGFIEKLRGKNRMNQFNFLKKKQAAQV